MVLIFHQIKIALSAGSVFAGWYALSYSLVDKLPDQINSEKANATHGKAVYPHHRFRPVIYLCARIGINMGYRDVSNRALGTTANLLN
jgi:hypothetical protein